MSKKFFFSCLFIIGITSSASFGERVDNFISAQMQDGCLIFNVTSDGKTKQEDFKIDIVREEEVVCVTLKRLRPLSNNKMNHTNVEVKFCSNEGYFNAYDTIRINEKEGFHHNIPTRIKSTHYNCYNKDENLMVRASTKESTKLLDVVWPVTSFKALGNDVVVTFADGTITLEANNFFRYSVTNYKLSMPSGLNHQGQFEANLQIMATSTVVGGIIENDPNLFSPDNYSLWCYTGL